MKSKTVVRSCFIHRERRGDYMELKLIGYNPVRITHAELVGGGDILIEVDSGFDEIAKTYDCDIKEAYLVEVDFKWSLVVWFDLSSNEWAEEHAAVIHIKNQDNIYKLSARL